MAKRRSLRGPADRPRWSPGENPCRRVTALPEREKRMKGGKVTSIPMVTQSFPVQQPSCGWGLLRSTSSSTVSYGRKVGNP